MSKVEGSFTEQLSRTKENMLTIIDQYKEKLSLAISHGQRLEDEHVKVSTLQVEREARERVIESFHEEAVKWMDRFALTLNGNKLLFKAKYVIHIMSQPTLLREGDVRLTGASSKKGIRVESPPTFI